MSPLGILLFASIAALAPRTALASEIDGRVLDAHGAPAAGVRVIVGELGHATLVFNTAREMFPATPGIPDAEAKRWTADLATDRDGKFVAKGLGAGEFTVLAADEKRGFAIASARVAADATKVELALTPPAFLEVEVAGLEHDPQRHVLELKPIGNPLNVQWVPRLELGKGWSFASSPLPGFYSWRLIGSEVVFAQDYRATRFATSFDVVAGEHTRVAIDLAKGAAIDGRISDGTGAPLSGVSVVARAASGGDERGAITGADGRFQMRGLSEGACRLEASRWTMRDQVGCGNGSQDVFASREISVPLASAGDAEFVIPSLLTKPKVGDVAPSFTARALDGRELDLRELRGKVVLVDFWATWCGICRTETSRLAQTYADLARDGRFEIIGVSLDVDLDLVPRFTVSRDLRWPQTALGPAETNPIARLYNVNSTPDTVLIDESGKIAALHLTGEPLRKKIEELLANR